MEDYPIFDINCSPDLSDCLNPNYLNLVSYETISTSMRKNVLKHSFSFFLHFLFKLLIPKHVFYFQQFLREYIQLCGSQN